MFALSQLHGFNAADGGDPTLVLWLKGDSFVDSSMYGTVIEQDSATISGGAYYGDGASRFETGSNEANFVLCDGPFTIEFELKRSATSAGAVIGKTTATDSAALNPSYWLISMSVTGAALTFERNGGTYFSLAGTTPPGDGNYHKCKFTYDGTTLRYYLDDVLNASALMAPFADYAYALGIMCENSYAGIPYLGYGTGGAYLKNLKIYKGRVV